MQGNSISMATFMWKINQANPKFNYSNSSLTPLYHALGGRSLLTRTFTDQQIVVIRRAMNTLFGTNQQKYYQYGEAMRYLNDSLYSLEEKVGWVAGELEEETQFIHASTVPPGLVQVTGGLDPRFAREICIPAGGNVGVWPYCRFVFAFKLDEGADVAANGTGNIFGSGGTLYLITLPAGTVFYCQHGRMAEDSGRNQREIGFPNFIPMNCIEPYQMTKRRKRERV